MNPLIRHIAEAQCDAPGCTETEIVDVPPDATPEQAADILAEHFGWSIQNDKHYCPECTLDTRITTPGAHAAADGDDIDDVERVQPSPLRSGRHNLAGEG